jgi:hypothetical protein
MLLVNYAPRCCKRCRSRGRCHVVNGCVSLQWLPFLACLEAAFPNLSEVAEACAGKAGLDWDVLTTCSNGPEGKAIQVCCCASVAQSRS